MTTYTKQPTIYHINRPQGYHSFTDKNAGHFQDPMKNFPGSFCSQRMFKYNVLVSQIWK